MPKFVDVSIEVSSDSSFPIEYYLNEDGSEMSLEQIKEWHYENCLETVAEDPWASWDINVEIIEREEEN